MNCKKYSSKKKPNKETLIDIESSDLHQRYAFKEMSGPIPEPKPAVMAAFLEILTPTIQIN
jgi:hypothetical protein